MVKLSVCIPAYNPGEWLKRLLKELCAQIEKYPDTEIVVVDDGSTENLWWVTGFPHTRFIRLPHNSGDAAARNALLDAAHGEYIQFLDADDEIYPDALDVIYSNIEKGFDFVSYEFATDHDVHRSYHNRGQLMVNCPVWGYTFRREFIGNQRFDTSLSCTSDVEWLPRVLCEGAIHWHDNRAWYNYRFDGNEGSLSHQRMRGEI